MSFGLPAATGIRKGAAPVVATPAVEKVAARATVADQHARLSTVPVDDIERVQQQFAAFVSSGQLPEMSLAEIPDLGFAIDDSTFESDALKSLTEATGDLDDAEPQLAHLGPSLTSLVGGGGGGFGGGGGAGSAGVSGHGATENSASEVRDSANGQSVQSVQERDDRGGSNGGGSGASSTGSSNGNSGSASSGSASNGSGPTGGVATPNVGSSTSTPRGGPPVGGPADSAPGRVGGVGSSVVGGVGGSVATVVTQVPEPSSILLMGLGLFGAASTLRRQRPR